jgi:PAS domain S-box-containing protein
MDDLWRFLSATALGNVVVALGISLTVLHDADGSVARTALSIVASHAAAILVIVPVVMVLGPSTIAGRTGELAAQAAVLIGVLGYVFSPGQHLGLTFVPLPLLLWAALRFGLRVVSYELVAVAIVTTVLTAMGGGPFAVGSSTGVATATTSASLVQAFLIVSALIALPFAVALDQRRTALARMSQNEELFHKSFSESFVGMLLLYLSPDGLRIRELNQTAAEILGGTVEDLDDRPLQPLLDTSTSLDKVAAQMQSGGQAGWREEMWLASGTGRRVALALSPLSTSTEEAMFSAQLMDITDVHVATSRLHTEKDFTGAVLNTTACLIVVVDLDGKVVGLNPAGEKASGYSEEQVLDQPLWGTLVPTRERAEMGHLIDRTRPGRETPSVEGDLLTKQGGLRRVVWTSGPLTDGTGRRTHVVLTGLDVTDERNVRTMTNHLLDSATATAFIGVNLTGTITIFSTGAQELLGYRSGEVTGRMRFESLVDPVDLAEAAQEEGTPLGFPALVAGVGSGPRTRDWTCIRNDGSRVVCAVTMSAVRDAFGTQIGYLAVARDVTESRRSEQVLVEALQKEREAVERLQDLDRSKSDFVSMVSHELRTPITSIVGYTEMLQDGAAGPVNSDQTRLLDRVRRNGERLVNLIEDLLTLSSIEAGTFRLEKSSIDVGIVVNRAREALAPMLAGRNLDVRFQVPHRPITVLGDPWQLERVVINLVGNAVKFTEDGGRVHCALSTGDGVAQLEISDTGIGIPEDEQGALFTRFFRSSTAQERAIQGTGLGLSIVQSIVHSHGGEVAIRSRHLVGTEVRVILPLIPEPGELPAQP